MSPAKDISDLHVAAEQGDATAQFNLGVKYATGSGVPKDEVEAVKWYRKAAKQGNADAQCNLGWRYGNGCGVEKDDVEAVRWYRKAAEQGNAHAQFNLGVCYANGQGVAKDDAEAVKLYRKAAEKGHADAQCNLGVRYENGRGMEKDDVEAAMWYRKAAEQGEAYAQLNLGVMYDNGRGVAKDDTEAAKWYGKSAAQGNARAQFCLGWFLANGRGMAKNENEAVKWYRKAAEQGDALAQYYLALMYANGSGVEKDEIEAAKWCRKAAEQGNAQAQCNLGVRYENGRGVLQDKAEAVRWYRKAAQQGHEDAKKHLARLNVAVEEPVNADKVSSPQQRSAQRKNAPLEHKPPLSDKPSRESAECKLLLDACTPMVYRHNAFRITGLAVDASTRDIKRRIDDLKAAEEMGDAKDEHKHAFALDPPPSINQIRESAQRLQDPERRIIDEFFWFWPMEWGKGNSDPALTALKNRDQDAAFKIWSHTLSDDRAPVSAMAKHNLAVMYQLVALDSEFVALENVLVPEQYETISKYWHTCFKWWEELTDDEAFWSLVTDRIRILDDQYLTTGFARRMRTTLPEAMDKINAMLAISFAEQGKLSLVAKHITYMKETNQGRDNIPKTLAVITKPLKTRVFHATKNAIDVATRQPKQAAISAREMLQAIAEPLQIICIILPPDDHDRIDLCDGVAEACLTCQTAYVNETEDWETSIEILDSASKIAASHETKTRLSENRNLISLAKRFKEVDSKQSMAEKVRAIQSDVLPYLQSIECLPGMTAEQYEACADRVARYVRGLSVSAYNENRDVAAAIRILDIAIATARGVEAQEQLQKDKVQLRDILAETTNHNLHMQIRGDTIEVTNEFVQYNNLRIIVSQIQGIKYGVFVQYTNGARSSSSYLIHIISKQAEFMRIECKRFFRSDVQAEQDFNQILQSLFYQVIPSLVQRLAEGVVAGGPLPMGDCRLTAQGMYITTGALFWKKEHLVSYSDIRHGISSGHLSVSSAKDQSIKSLFSLRDTWNAVIFEFIVKAVIEMLQSQQRQASV